MTSISYYKVQQLSLVKTFKWLLWSHVSRLKWHICALPNHIFTTNDNPQKRPRRQFVIFEVSDVDVQVCTAHNTLIISQPRRLGITLQFVPAPFYVPKQYGSEVFKRIASMLNRIPQRQLHSKHEDVRELNNTHIPCDLQPEVVKARSVKYEGRLNLRLPGQPSK